MANHAFIAIIFLLGAISMLFLVILSGVTRTTPLDNTYFLEASTAGIRGALPITRWTFFYICSAPRNLLCSPAHPAMGIGYAWSPLGAGAPFELVGPYENDTTSYHFWYMWRFGWVFYLMSLIFMMMTLLTSLLACFGRLGNFIAFLAAGNALFFFTIAVSLMTATFVQMRNAFWRVGRPAQLGANAFGLSWGAWAALAIAVGLFFLGSQGEKVKVTDHVVVEERRHRDRGSHHHGSHHHGSSRHHHRSRRSSRSVGRTTTTRSTRRVKEEYP